MIQNSQESRARPRTLDSRRDDRVTSLMTFRTKSQAFRLSTKKHESNPQKFVFLIRAIREFREMLDEN